MCFSDEDGEETDGEIKERKRSSSKSKRRDKKKRRKDRKRRSDRCVPMSLMDLHFTHS